MVWMFFVERVCQKDIFRIHADSPKKKMPPTQRDCRHLLSGLSFDFVGRALRPISDLSMPK